MGDKAREVIRLVSVTLHASHGIQLTRMLGDENTAAIMNALDAAGLEFFNRNERAEELCRFLKALDDALPNPARPDSNEG